MLILIKIIMNPEKKKLESRVSVRTEIELEFSDKLSKIILLIRKITFINFSKTTDNLLENLNYLNGRRRLINFLPSIVEYFLNIIIRRLRVRPAQFGSGDELERGNTRCIWISLGLAHYTRKLAYTLFLDSFLAVLQVI